VTTVIAVYNSDGCVGRCDAKCHYATSRECDCICGGRLHGSQHHAVEQNTRDLLGNDIVDALQAFAKLHDVDAGELRLEFPSVQRELFA
jgi:hypothetical protein